MQQLRKHWRSIFIIVFLIGALIGWYTWLFRTSAADAALTAPVTRGTFRILVTTTGELKASQSIPITGPTQAMSVGVFQTKISSIVPEGSVVKAGDTIAELDRTPVATLISSVMLDLQKAQATFTEATLDSTQTLAQAREDIRTAEFGLQQKKLLKDEAQYEAPMLKQQAEIDYELASRALDQAKNSLTIKTKQENAKISSAGADLNREQNSLKALQDVLATFTILAPAPGMVIYARDGTGTKKGVNSQWSPWNPIVATLPDLTHMESHTYVNEVDIRKIAVGQHVQITLDADASKQLAGTVTQIANVGEQRPNQDGNVFEVTIQVVTPDTTLRPGMTTANAIETASIPNVLSVPLEAVVTVGGFSYVYTQHGRTVVKQMIEPGAANDDAIIVRRGLTQNDRVLLAVPADTAGIPTRIIPGLKAVRAAAPVMDVARRPSMADTKAAMNAAIMKKLNAMFSQTGVKSAATPQKQAP